MDDRDRVALERARKIEKVGNFLHERYVEREALLDIGPWSTTVHMSMDLRKRKEYRLREIIREVEKLAQDLRYDTGARLPADLDGYFSKLLESIPTDTVGK